MELVPLALEHRPVVRGVTVDRRMEEEDLRQEARGDRAVNLGKVSVARYPYSPHGKIT